MAKLTSNLEFTDTFNAWFVKTNQILEDERTVIVTTAAVSSPNTTNGAWTTGNAHVEGYFSSNTLIATDLLRGGTTTTSADLIISSNTIIQGEKVDVNGLFNLIGNTDRNITTINSTTSYSALNINLENNSETITPLIIGESTLTKGDANTTVGLGTSSLRWDGLYATLGDFSGTLDVDDDATFGANVDVAYDVSANNLVIAYDATFGRDVSVGDELTVTTSVTSPLYTSAANNVRILASQTINLEGNLVNVENDLSVGEDISVTGNTEIGGDLTLAGDADLNGNVSIADSLEVATQLDVPIIKNADLNGRLTIDDNAIVNQNLEIRGDLDVGTAGTGDITVADKITAGGDVAVGGALTVTGATTLENNLTVSGSIFTDVIGGTEAETEISIIKDVVISANLQVEEELSVNNAAYFYDDVSLEGSSLSIIKNLVGYDGGGAPIYEGGDLSVGGDMVVNGTLSIPENTIFKVGESSSTKFRVLNQFDMFVGARVTSDFIPQAASASSYVREYLTNGPWEYFDFKLPTGLGSYVSGGSYEIWRWDPETETSAKVFGPINFSTITFTYNNDTGASRIAGYAHADPNDWDEIRLSNITFDTFGVYPPANATTPIHDLGRSLNPWRKVFARDISASGTVNAGVLKGLIDWSYIQNAPDLYTTDDVDGAFLAVSKDEDTSVLTLVVPALTGLETGNNPRIVHNGDLYLSASDAELIVGTNGEEQGIGTIKGRIDWDFITNKPTLSSTAEADLRYARASLTSGDSPDLAFTTTGKRYLFNKPIVVSGTTNYVEAAEFKGNLAWTNVTGKPTYFPADPSAFVSYSELTVGSGEDEVTYHNLNAANYRVDGDIVSTGNIKANTFDGSIDWTNVAGRPEVYTKTESDSRYVLATSGEGGTSSVSELSIGDLTVNTLKINDGSIVLNADFTGATPVSSHGIIIERGTKNNAQFFWDESENAWKVNTPHGETETVYNEYPVTSVSTSGNLAVVQKAQKNQITITHTAPTNTQVPAGDYGTHGISSITIDDQGHISNVKALTIAAGSGIGIEKAANKLTISSTATAPNMFAKIQGQNNAGSNLEGTIEPDSTSDTLYFRGVGPVYITQNVGEDRIEVNHSTSKATSSTNSGGKYIQSIELDDYGHITGITATNVSTGVTKITAGGGITVDASTGDITVSHKDTSSQESVNNANGTVIQDVTLDTYGHITGLASVNLDDRYLRNNTNATTEYSILAKGGVSIAGDRTTHIDSDGAFYRYDGQAYITVDDNLYVRDSGSDVKFYFNTNNGNFTATGEVTAFSDERLKSNIRTIDGALEMVSNMRGVRYEKDDKENVGVIAQEMEEILPEVVSDVVMGDETYKTVSYGNIVGVLIEAIKELKAEIEELKGNK